jgi:hypothetical protein
MTTESAPICEGNLCTTARFEVLTQEGHLVLCMSLHYTDTEIGGVEIFREMGCTGAIGGVSGTGVTLSKAGFLVGFGTTHMDLDNTLDDTNRSIHVSASFAVTSAVERDGQSFVLADVPEAGCTTNVAEKTRSVAVAGTLFVGATLPAGGTVTEFGGTGTSTDVAWRTKVRC